MTSTKSQKQTVYELKNLKLKLSLKNLQEETCLIYDIGLKPIPNREFVEEKLINPNLPTNTINPWRTFRTTCRGTRSVYVDYFTTLIYGIVGEVEI